MATDLNKLKQFLRPATVDEVRRARLAEEQAPDEPGFVYALEAEMRDEFLACAHTVAREKATVDAQRLTAM